MASVEHSKEMGNDENDAQDVWYEKIPLRLMDQDGTVLIFRVKRSVPFRKILEAFSRNVGKNSAEFRMLFNGKNVNLCETPGNLGLSGNEELEVVTSQVGG